VTSFALVTFSHWCTLAGPHKVVTEPSDGALLSLQMREGALCSAWFWAHFVARGVLIYTLFTPIHEACHGSVASSRGGARVLNAIVGHGCALQYGVPFRLFCHLHLDHHKFTNNADGWDPDVWSGGGWRGAAYARYGPWLLPLRCVTQLLGYVYHTLAHYLHHIPRAELLRDIGILAVGFGAPLCCVAHPPLSYLFYMYQGPVFLATFLTALGFDYLPHRPHDDAENSLLASSFVTLWNVNTFNSDGSRQPITKGDVARGGIAWLTAPLLYQNYHMIHHLFPWVPFYKYSEVYARVADELHKGGAGAYSLFPIVVYAPRSGENADDGTKACVWRM
jgi:fatty acid desaturase